MQNLLLKVRSGSRQVRPEAKRPAAAVSMEPDRSIYGNMEPDKSIYGNHGNQRAQQMAPFQQQQTFSPRQYNQYQQQ